MKYTNCLQAAGLFLILSLSVHTVDCFSPFFAATTTAAADVATVPETVSTKDVVSCVAVAGATGRTGRLVVQELLDRGVNVVAMVRDPTKASEVFEAQTGPQTDGLDIVKCDLMVKKQIEASLKECDALIWCATGFSDSSEQTWFDKLSRLFGVATKRTVDLEALPTIGDCFSSSDPSNFPKVVMCSSAGVTRPSWTDQKKERLSGCADIPIVRLNPFGILDIKCESEEVLRQSGSSYCIFRPAGLNDKWPVGSRPIFSQGDVAVGRINRKDVAKILVDILSTEEATGKTFEAVTIAGYPPPTSIGMALSRFSKDADGPLSDDVVEANYAAMQQLLPGEKQDAASLAMGQTYEQLDKNEVGRLGEKGKEDAEAVAPKPSS